MNELLQELFMNYSERKNNVIMMIGPLRNEITQIVARSTKYWNLLQVRIGNWFHCSAYHKHSALTVIIVLVGLYVKRSPLTKVFLVRYPARAIIVLEGAKRVFPDHPVFLPQEKSNAFDIWLCSVVIMG